MYMSLFPPGFLLKLTIWLVCVIAFMTMCNAFMRKVLGVKKKEFFSYNFVNDIHKKGEWIIRITFVIIYILIFALGTYNPFFIYAAIGFTISLSGFRAIIEKKYAENPKDYLFTLSELGFIVVIVLVMTLIVFPEYIPSLLIGSFT